MDRDERILLDMVNAAVKAGGAILEVKNKARYSVKEKADNSPVTDADYAAQDTINSFLGQTGIPVISEEGAEEDYSVRKNWDEVFIVDPLDGTKEFINGSPQYGVNIALCRKGSPVFGVIYLPEDKALYFGTDKIPAVKASVQPGVASFSGVDEIRASQLPASARTGHYICLASKSARTKATEDYYKALTERIPGAEILPMGSCVKYCTLAEGLADEYTRMGSVMEWDTAAGDALLRSLGMPLRSIETGEPLMYNKQVLRSSDFTVKNPAREL